MTRMFHLLSVSALRKAVVPVLCASLLIPMAPRRARATAIEYAVLLALIRVLVTDVDELPPQTQQPAHVLTGELDTAIESASAANEQGSVTGEISALEKAIGIETALQHVSSTCSDCSEFAGTLEEIVDASTSTLAALTPPGV